MAPYQDWGKHMRGTLATLGASLIVVAGIACPALAQSTGDKPAAQTPVKSPEQIRCELFGGIEPNACVIPRGKMIDWITKDNKPVKDPVAIKGLQRSTELTPRKPRTRPVQVSGKSKIDPPVTLTPVRSSDLFINFDLGSADVNPQAEGQTKNLIEAVRQFGLNKYRFEIAGHTDSVGSLAYNDDLSRRRAETIAKLLRLNGMDASNLVVKGYAYRMPLEGLQRTDGRNRRVEIVLLKEEPAAPAAK